MSATVKILIVEDHEALREVMVEHLAGLGHYIVGAGDAEEMDERLAEDDFDLMVLDLQLPGEDGISIAQRLKKSKPSLYIIMMTAKASDMDKVHGYTSGADVYLPKPTTPELLAAAINSLSRRMQPDKPSGLHFDFTAMSIQGDHAVKLTKQESLILKALLEAPGQMLNHMRLMSLTDKNYSPVGKANLEVQMARLRKKLADVGAPSPAIKVVRNQGYQLLCNTIVLK